MSDSFDRDRRVRLFWNAYARAARASGADFKVIVFGDTAELADELVAQVVGGTKRASARLRHAFAAAGHALPKVGDFGVVIDGTDTPRCILRTVQVDIKQLGEVDARFAWDEGGGDRSLEWWITAHLRYFKRQAAPAGFTVNGDTEVVFERFEVVWPPEFADRATYFYGRK
ncbi:MAG TPA: ASCH domain-containing protein [Candidatus Baltobacteraceae bacterium]|nr:ASCH domain-containing protein [Candidatus Baltobacteraceae bacterium]